MCKVTYEKYSNKYHLEINGKSVGMFYKDEIAKMAFEMMREAGIPNV